MHERNSRWQIFASSVILWSKIKNSLLNYNTHAAHARIKMIYIYIYIHNISLLVFEVKMSIFTFSLYLFRQLFIYWIKMLNGPWQYIVIHDGFINLSFFFFFFFRNWYMCIRPGIFGKATSSRFPSSWARRINFHRSRNIIVETSRKRVRVFTPQAYHSSSLPTSLYCIVYTNSQQYIYL